MGGLWARRWRRDLAAGETGVKPVSAPHGSITDSGHTGWHPVGQRSCSRRPALLISCWDARQIRPAWEGNTCRLAQTNCQCEYGRGQKPQVSVTLKDQSGTLQKHLVAGKCAATIKLLTWHPFGKSFFDAKPAFLLLYVPLWFHFVGTWRIWCQRLIWVVASRQQRRSTPWAAADTWRSNWKCTSWAAFYGNIDVCN